MVSIPITKIGLVALAMGVYNSIVLLLETAELGVKNGEWGVFYAVLLCVCFGLYFFSPRLIKWFDYVTCALVEYVGILMMGFVVFDLALFLLPWNFRADSITIEYLAVTTVALVFGIAIFYFTVSVGKIKKKQEQLYRGEEENLRL